jgi:hypothetical protein
MEARVEGVLACFWEEAADTAADEPARATGASQIIIKMIRDPYVLTRNNVID